MFFDPQIGFALENPVVPNSLNEFTCMSNYTPSQVSRIPYDSSDGRLFLPSAEKASIDVWLIFLAENIQIHQPSLSVLPNEMVRLSCEIQYGTKVDRKIPTIFWFEDIHNVSDQRDVGSYRFVAIVIVAESDRQWNWKGRLQSCHSALRSKQFHYLARFQSWSNLSVLLCSSIGTGHLFPFSGCHLY